MTAKSSSPKTPLTPRADRSDRDVRLFEETILALRGWWPATATGLCVSANSLFGFSFGGGAANERTFRARLQEALRLLEALDGPGAVERVRTLANAEVKTDRHAVRTRRAPMQHVPVA